MCIQYLPKRPVCKLEIGGRVYNILRGAYADNGKDYYLHEDVFVS